MNFPSLPAFFPRVQGGGIGVFGGAGGFPPPRAGKEGSSIGFAHQQQDSRGSVLGESKLLRIPAGTQNVSVLPVSWCRVLATEFLGSMMGKDVGHGCWVLGAGSVISIALHLQVPPKVDVPPFRVRCREACKSPPRTSPVTAMALSVAVCVLGTAGDHAPPPRAGHLPWGGVEGPGGVWGALLNQGLV